MVDYGITEFMDENMLYIRQPHCGTNLRVRKDGTAWVVEVANDDEHPQEIYVFGDEQSALDARDRLAKFINYEAAQSTKQGARHE